jgi:hypothetical protein
LDCPPDAEASYEEVAQVTEPEILTAEEKKKLGGTKLKKPHLPFVNFRKETKK